MVYTAYKNDALGDGLSLFYPQLKYVKLHKNIYHYHKWCDYETHLMDYHMWNMAYEPNPYVS